MEFDNPEENFLLYGECYTEAEVLEARGVRDLPESEEKSVLVAGFEQKTGKIFPVAEPVRFSFNPDTACLSSLEIQRSAEWVINHPRESRTRLPL